jgi:hypothetical protein
LVRSSVLVSATPSQFRRRRSLVAAGVDLHRSSSLLLPVSFRRSAPADLLFPRLFSQERTSVLGRPWILSASCLLLSGHLSTQSVGRVLSCEQSIGQRFSLCASPWFPREHLVCSAPGLLPLCVLGCWQGFAFFLLLGFQECLPLVSFYSHQWSLDFFRSDLRAGLSLG